MRTHWLLVALAVLLMGVSFYRPESRGSAPSADLAQIADLRAQVAKLTAELSAERERSESALAARDARPAASACLQASAQPPSAVPAPKTEELAARPVPAAAPEPARPPSEPPANKVYEPVQQLMTTFEAEVTDASWASGAEDTLEQRITSALPSQSSIQSVECRSTMCRVTTVHRDPQMSGSFVDAVFKSPETRVWSADALSEAMPNERGTGTLVVSYVAREGQMLALSAN